MNRFHTIAFEKWIDILRSDKPVGDAVDQRRVNINADQFRFVLLRLALDRSEQKEMKTPTR